MKGVGEPTVIYTEAVRRVLAGIYGKDNITNASQVGAMIWPKNDMHPQGLGGAASRIIRKMEKDGLVYWAYRGDRRYLYSTGKVSPSNNTEEVEGGR